MTGQRPPKGAHEHGADDSTSASRARWVSATLVVLVLSGAAWLLFNNSPPDANQEEQARGIEEAAGEHLDDRTPERERTPSLEGLPNEELRRIMEKGRAGEELTAAERERLAAHAAKELNEGREPASCTTHCDCPQGQTCQSASSLCMPASFKIWCCDKPGCPEGEQCIHKDGRYGTCGADGEGTGDEAGDSSRKARTEGAGTR